VFALQAVVIIGGVVRLIPLTGVTLPFVSFGGSSVIANMILLALLLMISNDARRPRPVREPEDEFEALPA
jgi:cell division protein FtsW (lipid II flippase)